MATGKDSDVVLLEVIVVASPMCLATTSEWARRYGELREVDYEMYAIAGTGDHWLLYDSETRLFSLAQGCPDDRPVLVGFCVGGRTCRVERLVADEIFRRWSI